MDTQTDSSFLLERETQLLAEIACLHQEIEQLKRNNCDLQMTLLTTAEHGDMIEAQLQMVNQQLQAEILERRRTEVTLQAVLDAVSKQKDDLEIIIQTIIEHGDVVDAQWCLKVHDMRLLATLDGLTQIANRRRFDEHLEQQWRQMARAQAPLSLLLCDIDYFKQYNDAYGHLAGDDCLKQVAQLLSQVFKRPTDLVARYGGEEFAAILPNTDIHGATAVARQIQSRLEQLRIPHTQSSTSPYVTLSIGVATTVPVQQRSPNLLLNEADRLLYIAKQQGRNQIATALTVVVSS